LGKLLVTFTAFVDLLLVKPVKSVVIHFSDAWRPSKQKKTPFADFPWESSCRKEGAGLQGMLMSGMLKNTELVGNLLLKHCGFLVCRSGSCLSVSFWKKIWIFDLKF